MSTPLNNLSSLKDLKKIGFIVPSSNITLETITSAILTQQLPSITAHYSRIPVTHLSSGAVSQFTVEKLTQCAELIAHAPVSTILWNGTSESWTGEGYEAGLRITDSITQATGLPSSTTSLALVEILKDWGIKRIALATPYTESLNLKLVEYYASVGITVVKSVGLGIEVNNRIADVSMERIRELIREANSNSNSDVDADRKEEGEEEEKEEVTAAECIVIPCTNFPAALVVEEMEDEIAGKPIFDSVLATLRKALRLVGNEVPVYGWGRLMRRNRVLEDLDAVMEGLRRETAASRTTLRIDVLGMNCAVERVVAESLDLDLDRENSHGIVPIVVRSLRGNTSINQRALDTCRWINRTGRVLVQADMRDHEVRAPRALMDGYGVRAQMLLPLMGFEEGNMGIEERERDAGEGAVGWISVHFVSGVRSWSEGDIEALREAGRKVRVILKEAGWVETFLWE